MIAASRPFVTDRTEGRPRSSRINVAATEFHLKKSVAQCISITDSQFNSLSLIRCGRHSQNHEIFIQAQAADLKDRSEDMQCLSGQKASPIFACPDSKRWIHPKDEEKS
jgi:hypothetical protein